MDCLLKVSAFLRLILRVGWHLRQYLSFVRWISSCVLLLVELFLPLLCYLLILPWQHFQGHQVHHRWQNLIVSNPLSSEEGFFSLTLGDFASDDPNQAKVSFPALAEDWQSLFCFRVFMETHMLWLQKAPLLCKPTVWVSDNFYINCFTIFICRRTHF